MCRWGWVDSSCFFFFFDFFFFFFNDTATTEIYTLSLHDALPIYFHCCITPFSGRLAYSEAKTQLVEAFNTASIAHTISVMNQVLGDRSYSLHDLFAEERRSEEHTSELQSLTNLVCRLLLEKKKKKEKEKRKRRSEEHNVHAQLTAY